MRLLLLLALGVGLTAAMPCEPCEVDVDTMYNLLGDAAGSAVDAVEDAGDSVGEGISSLGSDISSLGDSISSVLSSSSHISGAKQSASKSSAVKTASSFQSTSSKVEKSQSAHATKTSYFISGGADQIIEITVEQAEEYGLHCVPAGQLTESAKVIVEEDIAEEEAGAGAEATAEGAQASAGGVEAEVSDGEASAAVGGIEVVAGDKAEAEGEVAAAAGGAASSAAASGGAASSAAAGGAASSAAAGGGEVGGAASSAAAGGAASSAAAGGGEVGGAASSAAAGGAASSSAAGGGEVGGAASSAATGGAASSSAAGGGEVGGAASSAAAGGAASSSAAGGGEVGGAASSAAAGGAASSSAAAGGGEVGGAASSAAAGGAASSSAAGGGEVGGAASSAAAGGAASSSAAGGGEVGGAASSAAAGGAASSSAAGGGEVGGAASSAAAGGAASSSAASGKEVGGAASSAAAGGTASSSAATAGGAASSSAATQESSAASAAGAGSASSAAGSGVSSSAAAAGGAASSAISGGYVESEESHESLEEDCECVAYYLCKDGDIITDGAGLIDIRFGPGKGGDEEESKSNSQCQNFLDVCCRAPLSEPDPDITEELTEYEYEPSCGHRNPGGVSVLLDGFEEGESQFGEFPWMAVVLEEEKVDYDNVIQRYVCGGSLIADDVILTAAHCVKGKSPQSLRIRLGDWDTKHEKEIFPHEEFSVKQMEVHERFNSGNLFNDVALLFLSEKVQRKQHIDTLCLPSEHDNFDLAECVATGFGKDKFHGGQYQNIMKQVDLSVVPHGTCQSKLRTTRLGRWFKLHETFTCAGGEEGVDTCKGDGGSPLACPSKEDPGRYVQAGIVAWGIGCGEGGVPGVYASVTKLVPWINQKLSEYQRPPLLYSPPV